MLLIPHVIFLHSGFKNALLNSSHFSKPVSHLHILKLINKPWIEFMLSCYGYLFLRAWSVLLHEIDLHSLQYSWILMTLIQLEILWGNTTIKMVNRLHSLYITLFWPLSVLYNTGQQSHIHTWVKLQCNVLLLPIRTTDPPISGWPLHLPAPATKHC